MTRFQDFIDRVTHLQLHGGELAGAGDVAAHEAESNPHPVYSTDADLAAHAGGADPHPVYATDSDFTTHTGASDPHPGYQRESEKDVANGYAGLNASGLVPEARIDAAIARDSEVTSAIATHAAAGDPHTGYATDTDLSTHAAAADPHTGYLKESDVSGMATPAIVLGTAAAAGTGTSVIRHNSTIAAFDATVPSTQAFADAAATGSVAFAARRDHKHAMPVNPVTAHEAAGDPHPTYETSAEAATKITTHEAAADPHTGYQKESEKGAASGYAGLDAGTKVPTAQLGSGAASATTFLRGDQTWATPAGGGGAADIEGLFYMGGM